MSQRLCFLCPCPCLRVPSGLLNTCTSLCSSFHLCQGFHCRTTLPVQQGLSSRACLWVPVADWCWGECLCHHSCLVQAPPTLTPGNARGTGEQRHRGMQGFALAEIPWEPFWGCRRTREGLDEQSSVTVRSWNADRSLFNSLEIFRSDTYVYGCDSWGKESCA